MTWYLSWVETIGANGSLDVVSYSSTEIVVRNYAVDFYGNATPDGTYTVFKGSFTFDSQGNAYGPVTQIQHVTGSLPYPTVLLVVDIPAGQEPDISTFQQDYEHAVALKTDLDAIGVRENAIPIFFSPDGTEVIFDNGDGSYVRFIGQGLPTSTVHHADEIDPSATITRVERFDPNTNQVFGFADYSTAPENARFLVKVAFNPELIVADDLLWGDNLITTYNLTANDHLGIYTGAGSDIVDASTNTPDASIHVTAGGANDVIHTGTFTAGPIEGNELHFEDAYLPLGVSIDLTNTTQVTGIREVYGSSYNDVILGNADNGVISGFEGDDVLRGRGGEDWIWGDEGNDTISGGQGNDHLDGGIGTDTLDYSGTTGALVVDMVNGTANDGQGGTDTISNFENVIGGDYNDRIIGNAAANVLDGGNGYDYITGGAGNDTILGGALGDRLYGEDGNDIINGEAGWDRIYGGAGDDSIQGAAGNDTIHGDAGNDSIAGNGGNDIIYGDDGDDLIGGHSGNDNLQGGAGNDRIYGHTGNDYVLGGTGNDRLFGGDGNDTILGGDGHDRVLGGTGDDHIWGDAGNDRILGEDGNDRLHGGDGYDNIDGGAGSDVLRGGARGDTLSGGDGNDALYGEAGWDLLIGGRGHDSLFGDGGQDRLFGNQGNDILNGGAGNDLLWGGLGNDRFVFTDGFGQDVIYDFDPATDDVIDLSGVSGITDWTDLTTSHLATSSHGYVMIVDGSNSIELWGITSASQLSASDFIF